jgi:hypothetical protein
LLTSRSYLRQGLFQTAFGAKLPGQLNFHQAKPHGLEKENSHVGEKARSLADIGVVPVDSHGAHRARAFLLGRRLRLRHRRARMPRRLRAGLAVRQDL